MAIIMPVKGERSATRSAVCGTVSLDGPWTSLANARAPGPPMWVRGRVGGFSAAVTGRHRARRTAALTPTKRATLLSPTMIPKIPSADAKISTIRILTKREPSCGLVGRGRAGHAGRVGSQHPNTHRPKLGQIKNKSYLVFRGCKTSVIVSPLLGREWSEGSMM